tara:strand:+ start:774 stop:3125 length:2352 start_codon:yes stop_codon:yes gene_type:complete
MTESQNKSKKKGYNFAEVEPKIKAFWEKEKIFKFDPTKKNIYSIDTPPPTVSGAMHIGHAFSYAQQDFIARFRRMKQGVFYPFGTDDNGLPTERLVEKTKKVKSKDMSRAKFIELCLKTLKEITPDFIEDWKRIGVSADYDICYSTIDDNSRKIAQKSFIDLYNAKLAYQKDFPTIWCPECQTSIAQAELEDKESSTHFTTLKFNSEGKDLQIATTRPELLPACVAVFVNPSDKRYKKLVGKTAKVPLMDFEVPILEDESAEPDKGTGVLMVCSYGDRFDVDAINRHKLEPRVVLGKDGKFIQGPYKGMKISQAREKIIGELKNANLITEQKQIEHVLNTHDKCGTPIEFIPTKQWFIKVTDKKKDLIKQGKKINWSPKHMFKRYENWINGLEWDWSISRERHFGIPIPVWECEACNKIIIPKESELPIDPLQTKKKCPDCGKEATPESKVLDTWATSSMTPQIASSLINGKMKIPYSLRPQAHDIIRTWAFYTIVKSLYHEKQVPWNDIMVSGFVTLKGEKMSKSKGNVVAPQAVIEKYGADPLRFWAAGSKLGEDLDYQEQDLVAGKKTVTKLWNAAKFVFMNLEDYNGKKPKKLEKTDQEFLDHLKNTIRATTEYFEKYNYSLAKATAEKFFWNDFADNYIEIVKKRIYNETGDKKTSAQYVLYQSLLTILELFAPIMPFVTEEIYQTYFKKTEKEKSIHISEWPESKEEAKISKSFVAFCKILSNVRQAKTNAKKSMNSEITLTLSKEDQKSVEGMLEDFKSVVNAKEIKQGKFKVEFI